MKASGLNDDSRRLLKDAFGVPDRVWLVAGHFETKTGRDDLLIDDEGRRPALPDNRDLYYCVSECGNAGRKDPLRVRVLVLDDIGTKIDRDALEMMFPLGEASFQIETSPGCFQHGWIIQDGMAVEEYRALRAAMKASPIWGHADGIDAGRIFRLPQGTNTKPSKGGVWKVRLEKYTGVKIPGTLIVRLLGAPGAQSPGGAPGAVPGPGTTAASFEWTLEPEALQALLDIFPHPPQVDRETWVVVMHAVKGAGGSFEMFDSWASRWESYDAADTLRLWETTPEGAVRSRGGRLRAMVEAAAADDFEKWRAHWEPRSVFDDGEVLPVAGPVPGQPAFVAAMQLSVAEGIRAQHGERLRWNLDSKKWHDFTGTWKESQHRLGYRLARLWASAAMPSLGKQAQGAVSKNAFFEGVETILHDMLGVGQDAFDQDDWLLGTPGGTVDLRTGVLRAAVPGEMISLSTAVAPAEGEDCPQWLKFVDWMCTDPATGKVDQGRRRTMRQWAGYCLTGDVSKEMWMFFHGGGKNGKGTFLETLQAVMGGYFYMATKDLFMETRHGPHTEELAALARVRMVVADEVPVSAKWNESLLKGVSGGGTMTARHLYGKTFNFRIRFKVTISGNHKPTFQGEVNEALKRRLHMAGFLNTANPVDDGLKARLAGEGAGVLRWMLNGLGDMLSSPGGGLFIADSMLDATKEYLDENDLFGRWISEKTTIVKGGEAPAGETFKEWIDWRNSEGNHTMVGRPSDFKAEMAKRGFGSIVTKKGKFFIGLKVEVF